MERDTSRVIKIQTGPLTNLHCSRSGGRSGTRPMNSPIVYTQISPVKRTATLTTPTPTPKCPKAIPDATGDFVFLVLPSPNKGGGGVVSGRAAAAAKIHSCHSSSSARQGKRDKHR